MKQGDSGSEEEEAKILAYSDGEIRIYELWINKEKVGESVECSEPWARLYKEF